MQVFISMTSTLLAASEDANVLARMAEPDTRFVFSCVRQHVLTDDGTAPYELSWTQPDDDRPVQHEGRVTLADMPEQQIALWTRFRSIVADADGAGRIWWGAGRGNEDEVNPFFTHQNLHLTTYDIADRLRADGYTVHGR